MLAIDKRPQDTDDDNGQNVGKEKYKPVKTGQSSAQADFRQEKGQKQRDGNDEYFFLQKRSMPDAPDGFEKNAVGNNLSQFFVPTNVITLNIPTTYKSW